MIDKREFKDAMITAIICLIILFILSFLEAPKMLIDTILILSVLAVTTSPMWSKDSGEERR